MPESEPIPDIRDIAPPPEVAEPIEWLLWISIGLAALAFVGILIALFVWRSRRPSLSSPKQDPRELALDELHALRRDYVSIAPREFGGRAIAALRHVLGQRFGSRSLSLTPDEFFQRHATELSRQLGAEHGEVLRDLLRRCDQIRFAPDPDSPSAREPLAEAAIAFVRDLPEQPAAQDFQTGTRNLHPDDARPAVA